MCVYLSDWLICGFSDLQLEEEIQEDLKWCMSVTEVLHSTTSEFQAIELISSGPFGKVCSQIGAISFLYSHGFFLSSTHFFCYTIYLLFLLLFLLGHC